jgi:hypothetical protein
MHCGTGHCKISDPPFHAVFHRTQDMCEWETWWLIFVFVGFVLLYVSVMVVTIYGFFVNNIT